MNLEKIKLPEGLEMIGKMCFDGCRLEKVTFPSSLEEIGERAFYWNMLKKLSFEKGNRLRVVGNYAFGENVPLDSENVKFPEGAMVSESVFESASDGDASPPDDDDYCVEGTGSELYQDDLDDYSL